jgi:hypothetical protein
VVSLKAHQDVVQVCGQFDLIVTEIRQKRAVGHDRRLQRLKYLMQPNGDFPLIV